MLDSKQLFYLVPVPIHSCFFTAERFKTAVLSYTYAVQRAVFSPTSWYHLQRIDSKQLFYFRPVPPREQCSVHPADIIYNWYIQNSCFILNLCRPKSSVQFKQLISFATDRFKTAVLFYTCAAQRAVFSPTSCSLLPASSTL